MSSKMKQQVGSCEENKEIQNASFHETRIDDDFMPATLEVLDRPPAPLSRAMVIFVVVFAVVLVGWATFAKMDIVVSGMGVIIPKGKVKIVQPLESGIVTAIHVRDGQVVRKGNLLLTMDNTDSINDIATIKKELTKSKLTILRLDAQLNENKEMFIPPADSDPLVVALHQRLLDHSLSAQQERIDTLELEIRRCSAEQKAIQANVKRLTTSLPLAQEIFDKKSVLAKRSLIPKAELLQARIEISDAQHELLSAKSQLQEVKMRLERAQEEKDLAKTEYRRDILSQLSEARNTRESLIHQLAKAENRMAQSELRAPADGIVQQLAINTIGGVVTAAQPLLVIVPIDAGLEVEAKILNKDIGFISEDQDVSIKVTAYPFTRYGCLEGKIEWVAGDAVIDKELGPSYPIRVAVSNYELPNIVNGRQGVITPGMTVTTDVKVGQRRVIHYFLGPIFRYKDQSLREI